MASAIDFPTSGKVIEIKGDVVLFSPRGTTYQLHLRPSAEVPPINMPVDAIVRVEARKIWTVPSGGNFIAPIVGTPRIIQGRVRFLDERQLVVQAGANVIVDLPGADSALDLANGGIAVGMMVNVTAMPGARVEFVGETAKL